MRCPCSWRPGVTPHSQPFLSYLHLVSWPYVSMRSVRRRMRRHVVLILSMSGLQLFAPGSTTSKHARRGSLAVTADTLGRVVLWDLAAVTALRMWKGYRDAQCAWLVLPEVPVRRPAQDIRITRRSSSTAIPSPMDHDGSGSPGSQPSLATTAASPERPAISAISVVATSPAKSPEPKARKRKVLEAVSLRGSTAGSGRKDALHLVIYAPKRGVLELWPVRQGRRLRSMTCGGNCRLVAADPPLSTEAVPQQQCAWARDCVLLDFDTGSVTAVAPALLHLGQDS